MIQHIHTIIIVSVKEKLRFRLFQLELLLNLLGLTLLRAQHSFDARKSFLPTCLVFAATAGIFLNHLYPPQSNVIQEIIAAPPPPYIDMVEKEVVSVRDVKERITRLESVLQKQPTHFDLLINLSFLYQSINDDEKAAAYWLRAEELYPNHPLFKD